jgi:hypothetical protein
VVPSSHSHQSTSCISIRSVTQMPRHSHSRQFARGLHSCNARGLGYACKIGENDRLSYQPLHLLRLGSYTGIEKASMRSAVPVSLTSEPPTRTMQPLPTWHRKSTRSIASRTRASYSSLV